MADRNKRMKASDIFRETEFIFSKKVSFKEAFPSIKKFKIEVTFEGSQIESWNSTAFYTEKNPPGEYIDCRNSFCFGGGFSIGEILRDMVSIKQNERSNSIFCKGNEGSPKGKRIYRSCAHRFKYKVSITYHDEP